MISIFIQGLVVIAVIAVLFGPTFWVIYNLMEGKPYKLPALLSVVFWSLFFGVFIENEKENPCVKTETTMQYNPSTKTVMPLEVCVERGRWVE